MIRMFANQLSRTGDARESLIFVIVTPTLTGLHLPGSLGAFLPCLLARVSRRPNGASHAFLAPSRRLVTLHFRRSCAARGTSVLAHRQTFSSRIRGRLVEPAD